jgi:hypothetical protein
LLHGREGAPTPQPFELRAERIALGLSSISLV